MNSDPQDSKARETGGLHTAGEKRGGVSLSLFTVTETSQRIGKNTTTRPPHSEGVSPDAGGGVGGVGKT